MITASERDVLNVFRNYQITPGQLLCFSGSTLKKHQHALRRLVERNMVIKERFKGAYSLTQSGYHAMSHAQR
jgi:predicted transcriptional regulator